MASGIFNVRMNHGDDDWWTYTVDTLKAIDAKSTLAWAVNFLTSYSDKLYMRDDLYYADPCVLFDWAKRTASGNVALLHDYGLYEFTLLVRKRI